MATAGDLDITMDAASLYREEIYTDRRVGTIRALVPVDGNGATDSARDVVYVGEAQIMTQMGPLPVSFEIEAQDAGRRRGRLCRCRQGGCRADRARTPGHAPPGRFIARAARPGRRRLRSRRVGRRRQDPDAVGPQAAARRRRLRTPAQRKPRGDAVRKLTS